VAFERDRPVPWKRILAFVGVYSLIVFGLFAILKPGDMVKSIPGIVFGASIALLVMVVLSKFGWQPTMLKSKEDIAAARAEREQARAERIAAKKGQPSPSAKTTAATTARPKPPPTKRTSVGATNNPRRTRDSRKR
jgi:hypothetical protein